MKRRVKKRLKLRSKPVCRELVKKRRFVRQGDFKVYILQCSGGSYYTGHTNDLSARLKLHRSGKGARYVRSHRPFKLVYTKVYKYFKLAFAEERRIKSLERPEKRKLILSYRRVRRKRKGCRLNVG